MLRGTMRETIDLSQKHIRRKIRVYLAKSGRDEDVVEIFNPGNGYCNGFVSVALYAQYLESLGVTFTPESIQDDWLWFDNTSKSISTWNEDINTLTPQLIKDIDRFIWQINGFQNIAKYLPFGQGNLHCYLQDTVGRQLKLEYTFAGLFTVRDLLKPLKFSEEYSSLGNTLIEILLHHERRLVLVSCGNHSLGLFRYNHRISFFNPNNPKGRVYFDTEHYPKLVKAIFAAYRYKRREPSPIGFRIFTFDNSLAPYPPQRIILSQLDMPLMIESKTREVDYSALLIATRIGSEPCVSYYLDKGAVLDGMSVKKRTALYVASSRGYTDIARLLMLKKANIHIVCEDEKTPLLRACEKNQLTIVKLMIEYELSIAILIMALEALRKRKIRRELISLLDKNILNKMLADLTNVEKQILQYCSTTFYKKSVSHELSRLVKEHKKAMNYNVRLFAHQPELRSQSDVENDKGQTASNARLITV